MAFLPFARRPMRTQIALLTGLIALAVAGCVGLGAVLISRAQTVELVHEQLNTVAATLADRLGRAVRGRVREIAFLGNLEPIRDHWRDDPAVIRKVLELVKDGSSTYAWIGFADRDGRVLAATKGLLEGTSIRSEDWFAFGQLGPYVGDVYTARRLGLRIRGVRSPEVFDVATPIYGSDGELLGVLGAQVNWSWVGSVRDSSLVADLHANTQIMILRQDGSAIMGARYGEQVLPPSVAENIVREGRGVLEDKDNLTAFAVMQRGEGNQLGWIVLTRQPRAVALADVTRMTHIIAIIGILTGLVGFLIGYPLAGHLSRPLRALAAEADRIGRDRAFRTISLHRGSEEIERLSASLRGLLQRLGLEEQAHRESAEQADRLVEDLRSMRDLADTDPLTGLRNRRSFEEAAFYEPGTVVALLDIDRFKSVNDRFGHAAGDDSLRQVAAVLAANLREADICARLGGEEFVLLMRRTGIEGATRLAERLREAIAETITLPNGLPLTVSLGLAFWRSHQNLREVLADADDALYRAKQTGRNKVCVAEKSRAA